MDLKLKNNSNLILPLYDKVEYIESVGIPNISMFTVSLYGNDKVSLECEIEVVQEDPVTARIYYGVQNSAAIGLASNNSNTDFIAYGNLDSTNVSFSGRVYIKQKQSTITINNVTTTVSSSVAYARVPTVYLLPQEIKVRIYSFKRIQNNVVINNYIPVISHQEGHEGEPCLYDTIGGGFKYASSTGSFIAPTEGFYKNINTVYIKDCPNIDGINILRNAANLERIRCNINNITGHTAEIYKYAQLSGFNDAGEQQAKPRIVGTFNIDDYYTNFEIAEIRSKIDGVTIITPTASDYNVDYLLDNDLLAVQNLNDEVENYNPTVATILSNNGIGHNTDISFYPGFGTYLIKKTEAAAMTSWPIAMFRGNTTVETFNEFKYWTGLTSLPGGNGTTDVSRRGSFGGCTALESIEIPEGITTIGAVTFYGDSALSRIVLPSTLTTINDNNFNECSNLANVYFNGTLSNWMNISFHQTGISNPTSYGAHFYIDGEELTSLTIPQGTTSIKTSVFYGMKYITGQLVIPNTVTSIGASAFRSCSGFTGDLVVPDSVKTISDYAFSNTQFENATLPKTLTSCGNLATVFHGSKVVNLTIGCSSTLAIVSNASVWYGNGNGTLRVFANCSSSGTKGFRFKNVFIYGSMSATGNYCYVIGTKESSESVHSIRIRDTVTLGNYGSCVFSYNSTPKSNSKIHYVELYDFVRNSGSFFYTNSVLSRAADCIVHFRRNTLPTNCPGANVPVYKVGEGISKAADDATLALYLADSDWSTYSAKLGTWYDYNGEYKWYYVTDNLTNCTNTNPDEWPHITRENSYVTTIEPEDGYSINSVVVTMLDTDTTSQTYDTFVDITSSVYNSSTGEINIPSVTGNIIITASAI